MKHISNKNLQKNEEDDDNRNDRHDGLGYNRIYNMHFFISAAGCVEYIWIYIVKVLSVS